MGVGRWALAGRSARARRAALAGRRAGDDGLDVVRCLTADGIKAFGGYLRRLRRDGDLPPPRALLTDPALSRASALGDTTIETRGFSGRREFAEYIDYQVVEAGIFVDADETGMWEWLSLYYFDAVCPSNQEGLRRPGADARHLLADPDARRRHRHLLRGPYMLFRRFAGGPRGELDLLLGYALHVHGVAATHIGERPRLMRSPGTLAAASLLYVDPITRKPSRGYADERSGLRAYCRYLNNLPDCFDLSTLSADTVMALLPSEFAGWLNERSQDLSSDASPRALERLRGLASRSERELTMCLAGLLQDVATRKLTGRQATVRDDLFRAAVLGAYESRCVISGVGLRHGGGVDTGPHYEVEAGHIVPVSRGGRDLVGNGLAFTRTLHWAFDKGMPWVDDGLRVQLAEAVDSDSRNEWLRQFRGRPLRLPLNAACGPHRAALRWHATHVADG